MMLPSGLRSLLTIGPGPEGGGSRLNQRPHMPDKSGMDTPLLVSRLGGAVRGVNVCAGAGVVAAAVANMIDTRKPRCLCMPTSSCCVYPRDNRKPMAHLNQSLRRPGRAH